MAAKNSARDALILSLTVMEVIINFLIDIYHCFVELVLQGGLAIFISAVQEINLFVQNTAASICTSIQSDIAYANLAIQTAVSAISITGNCLLECYNWHGLKRHLERMRKVWLSDPPLVHNHQD